MRWDYVLSSFYDDYILKLKLISKDDDDYEFKN